ncbi:sphingosine 1-phosphate receptor 3-like [Rhinoderma darwinii]|uniref:sphingosine 1-phosphate receptor 3-like n=1 Tax=Rhinoderma darwinii TaxID=43563 RepID=UPI003F669CEA
MVRLSVSFDSIAYVLLFCFHIMVAKLSVTLNGLLAVTIFTTKALRSENRFIYILNTCLSDFSLGAVWFYAGLFDNTDNPSGIFNSHLLIYTLMGIIFLSILSSQCECHFAVVSPFKYMRLMTKGRTIGVVVFCWIFPFSMSLIYGLIGASTSSTIKGISNIFTNLAIFIIMVVLNIKLYLIAKGQQEREIVGAQKDSKKSSLRLIVIISSSFLFLWTPATVYECVCGFYACPRFKNYSTDPFVILIIVTPVINPILYLWGSRAIRSAMWKTLTPCATCQK